MSLFDGIKRFAQPYGDDDYDDYEDDEYIDDYAEEPVRNSRRRSAPVSAPPVEEDDIDEEDFGFDVTSSSAPASSAASAPASGFSGRVVNMHSGVKQEVVLFRPTSFNSTSKAADHLRANKAVVLNLENVDKAMGRRVVDFLSGCTYSMDGSIRKVAQNAYLFCPSNMEIVGDLETLQAEVESYI